MRIGSLFSGYGGLDLAVEEVFGATTAWVADVEPAACRVLERRFPGVPNLGDVTAVDWATVEPVDIIEGGSPCQDISAAGKRAGMTDGTRSNLWVAMREAIAVIQPTFVIWENVHGAHSATAASALEPCPGCVGDGGGKPALRALGRVLGDLAGLGFDAEWRSVRASDVGACHQRRRVFILAWRRDVAAADPDGATGREWRLAADGEAQGGWARPDTGRSDRTPLDLLPTPAASVANNGNGMGMPLTIAVQLLPTPTTEPATGNGHARNLGKEVRLLPTVRVENNENRQSEGYGGANGNFHGLLTGQTPWGQYAPAIARQERAFGYPAPSPTEPGKNGKPRLSARFAEWMMGAPPGWITDTPGVTRTEALRMAGNGVVTPQAVHALRLMLPHVPRGIVP